MDPTLLKHVIILVRFSIITVGLVAGYLALYYVVPYIFHFITQIPVYFSPFILALVMSLLIEPIVRRLQLRFKLPRGIAVLFALVVVWGTVALVLAGVVSRLVQELIELYRLLSSSSTGLSQSIVSLVENWQTFYLRLPIPPQVAETLHQNAGSLVEGVQTLVQEIMNALIGFLGALPGFFTIFLIATISTFFISRDRELIYQTLFGWASSDWFDRGRIVIRDLGSALVGFFRAQLILISITGVVTVIGLRILGVEYALTIGLVGGLLDILPIIGPGTLFIPWSLWTIAIGNVSFGCKLMFLYAIISIVRQLLEPKIVANNIGLHPLATLVGLFVGLKAGGVLGMILGPVTLVVFQAMRRAGIIANWSTKYHC